MEAAALLLLAGCSGDVVPGAPLTVIEVRPSTAMDASGPYWRPCELPEDFTHELAFMAIDGDCGDAFALSVSLRAPFLRGCVAYLNAASSGAGCLLSFDGVCAYGRVVGSVGLMDGGVVGQATVTRSATFSDAGACSGLYELEMD